MKFVDTGNAGIVARDSLVMLPSVLQARPALAIRCSMFSCTAWDEDSRDVLLDLVAGFVLRLEVMRREDRL